MTNDVTECLRQRADVSGLLLDDNDLMQIVGLKKSAFYRKKKDGLYQRFEVTPQLTGYTQYSGALVQRWRDGAANELDLNTRRRFKVAR